MDEARTRPNWPWYVGAALFIAAVAVGAVLLFGGGTDEAEAQTIQFQSPTEVGDDPFTEPADTAGKDKVELEPGQGPFGGTGSDRVCDRELLIRSLRKDPAKMAEWARVLDVENDSSAVAKYIRELRPVTLTRDTRVTNHTFVNGKAVGYQAILQAGTAVLVDQDGVPVARCRCGNPLLRPIDIPEAKCFGCPPDYRPPPPCDYYDYDDADYRRYGDDYFLSIFRRSDFVDVCYLPYPSPPKVRRKTPKPPGKTKKKAPAPAPAQATNPSAAFSPSSGTTNDTYTLSVSGFGPSRSLSVVLTRPDGVSESYTITTDSSGSGSKTFPRVDNAVLGTYTARVSDGDGNSASASTTVRAAQQQQQPETQAPPEQSPDAPQEGDALQCDPPRSQLESRAVRGAGLGAATAN